MNSSMKALTMAFKWWLYVSFLNLYVVSDTIGTWQMCAYLCTCVYACIQDLAASYWETYWHLVAKGYK